MVFRVGSVFRSLVLSSRVLPPTGNLQTRATTVLPVLDATHTGLSQRVKGEPGKDQMKAEVLVEIETEADGLTAIHPFVSASGISIMNQCSAERWG